MRVRSFKNYLRVCVAVVSSTAGAARLGLLNYHEKLYNLWHSVCSYDLLNRLKLIDLIDLLSETTRIINLATLDTFSFHHALLWVGKKMYS